MGYIVKQNFLKMKDIWVPIPGSDSKYFISNTGIVESRIPNKKAVVLSKRIDRAGYVTVRLSINGKSTTKYVHRLIADSFILRIHSKDFVNHKNGVKTDNRIENLEWVTHAENIDHAYMKSLIKPYTKTKWVTDTSNKGYSVYFLSVKDAALMRGIPYSTLKNYLSGKRRNTTNLAYDKIL
jgi:hypothetical protein